MEILSIIPKIVIFFKNTILYFHKKIFPPKYGYKLAFSNILEVIRPYSYKQKIIEVLGQPDRFERNSAAYRFSNALVQVNYSGDLVESVSIVLLRLNWPNRIKIHPINLTLGKHCFSDLTSNNSEEELPRIDYSSKFFCIWKKEYFGNQGRYFYYSFAAYSADTFPPIECADLEYEHAENNENQGTAIIKNKKLKFNAIAISANDPDCFYFDFSLFR